MPAENSWAYAVWRSVGKAVGLFPFVVMFAAIRWAFVGAGREDAFERFAVLIIVVVVTPATWAALAGIERAALGPRDRVPLSAGL